jgi:hypothetical protein
MKAGHAWSGACVQTLPVCERLTLRDEMATTADSADAWAEVDALMPTKPGDLAGRGPIALEARVPPSCIARRPRPVPLPRCEAEQSSPSQGCARQRS